MEYACTKERFLKDVESHSITFNNDSDGFRHIRFRNPDDSAYFFDLVTWPMHLCVSGDMGTYVFKRTMDMFDFFRNKDLSINPEYWSEKAESIDRNGGIKIFSPDLFQKNIFHEFRENCDLRGESRRECLKAIQDDILCFIDEESESDLLSKAMNFDFNGFGMQDFWDHNNKEYTYRFIWNLYAIVWGIQMYDAFKK